DGEHLVALEVGLGLAHVVRVVDDEVLGVLAGHAAGHAGRESPTRAVVDVIRFDVLVRGEAKTIAPATRVPLGLHQTPCAKRVADGEAGVVGAGEPAGPRLPGPAPGGPEDADGQALGRAGRDVDEQVVELPSTCRLEVAAEDIEMPAADERDRWLEQWPGAAHEVEEAEVGPRISRWAPDRRRCLD